MAKNLIACCDGTGNEVEGNLSNVLKLFRILRKDATQRVYYNPGIGTIANDDAWARLKQNTKAVFGLATGYGLDADILGAYRFLCENYEKGDSIYLFGFSRGAYTVRALAGFIHMVGLLPPDQLNLATYALTAYKRASETDNLMLAFNFGRITGGRSVTLRFVGVWDTVASVIVPRRDRLVPMLLALPYTRKNPSVAVFRHAMAIDERRRMFRLNRWQAKQPFVANRFDTSAPQQDQDVKQVWFAGVHSDVGGGYPETESGLSKYPLAWMLSEAKAHGVRVNNATADLLVLGQSSSGNAGNYVPPNFAADQHDSMNWGWRILEWLPKSAKLMEWPRPHFLGCYFPDSEPRLIDDGDADNVPVIHQSVADRSQALGEKYKPVNMTARYTVEPY